MHCLKFSLVHDYLAVVYHPMLTDEMDEKLERTQSRCLKYIYGWELSYATLRQRADLSTLRQRRVELCDAFAAKCLKHSRYATWFPLRGGRGGEKYAEGFARCERLKNSPLFYMRHRLNGKPGKRYGERNRAYRD